MEIWREIICLGDSLTYGARDEYGRSYPAELSKILKEKTKDNWFCHNYGINGNTSSDLYRRSWPILKSNENAKIVILLIGTNDTKIPIPTNIFQDNVSSIVSQAKCLGKQIIIGTIPSLGLSPAYLKNKTYIVSYNEILKKISIDYETFLVELNNLENFMIDGVHFKNYGNRKIAEIFSNFILEL